MPSSSNMRLCWYLLEKKQGAKFSVRVRQISEFMQRQSFQNLFKKVDANV